MKTALLLTAAFTLANASFAQNTNAPGQVNKTDPAVVTPAVPAAQDISVIRGNVEDAKNLAKGNSVAAAEQKLMALNHAKPNTAAWHMETAQRLMQTAEQLAREAHTASLPALAASALSHLDQAVQRAKDARTQAAAKTLAGFIHERYLADPVTALANYQAAALLAPSNAANAKEAADRLQKTDDNVKDKIAHGGK